MSWTVFALANVLIDLEPIALFFITGDPAHPWLHTLPGALGVAAVAAGGGRRGRGGAGGFLKNRRLPAQAALLLALTKNGGRRGGGVAVFRGLFRILLLGMIIQTEARLWPLEDRNPLQGIVSIGQLQWGCVAAGVVGLVVLAFRRRHHRGSP